MDVAVDALETRMRPNARDHVGVKSEAGRSTPLPQALTCGNGELGSGVGDRSRLEQPPRREHHRDQRGGERLLNQQATNDRTVAMASTPSRPRRRARATSVADQPAPATPVTVQVISPAAVCPATYNAAPVITSAVPASNAALSTRWSSAVVHARGASAGMSGAQMGQPRLSLRGLLTLAYPGERSMWTRENRRYEASSPHAPLVAQLCAWYRVSTNLGHSISRRAPGLSRMPRQTRFLACLVHFTLCSSLDRTRTESVRFYSAMLRFKERTADH
jgi:hypothetical protein